MKIKELINGGNYLLYLTEIIKKNGYDIKKWKDEKTLIVLEAPTGCGKTYFIQNTLQKICLQSNDQLALIVNRRILKSQLEKNNQEYMLKNMVPETPLDIYTYQHFESDGFDTEKEVNEFLKKYKYIIADEAHYFCSDPLFNPAAEKSLRFLMNLIGETCVIFLTATPKNLIPILDNVLERINASRMKEWEDECRGIDENKDEKINEYLQSICPDGDYAFMDFVDAYEASKDDSFFPKKYSSESSEDGSYTWEEYPSLYEYPLKPEPYDYQLIEENNPDYEYINLTFYDSKEGILKTIIDSNKAKKWLIFVNTKKEGANLKKELQEAFQTNETDKRTVSFISSDYKKNQEMNEIVTEIVQKKSYSVSILIATKVIDNGITLTDTNIENIVVSAYNEYEFIQMLGRRRVSKDEKINLYVPDLKISRLKKWKDELFRKFTIAEPLIKGKDENINSIILHEQLRWDIVNIFTYEDNNNKKFSQLTYYLFSKEYRELDEMIQAMDEDPHAFRKAVCKWLKKDFVPDSQILHEKISDEVYTDIANEIDKLPFAISRKEFDDFIKHLNDSINKLTIDKKNLNEILSQNPITTKYTFHPMPISKSTYIFKKIEGKYLFRLISDITNKSELEIFIKENKDLPTKDIFKKLFNMNMPCINEKDEVAFLSFCIQDNEMFKEISFRRNKEKLTFYSLKSKSSSD